MFSPDQLVEKSREIAQVRIAQNEARHREDAKRHEEIQIVWKKQDENFRRQAPEAEKQAIAIHRQRFQPLQDFLETPLKGSDVSLMDTVKRIRDEVFPNSPVLVADRYSTPYDDDPKRWLDNQYYRSLIVVDKDLKGLKGIFSLYVIAKEPPKRKILNLFTPPKTQYSLAIDYNRELETRHAGKIKPAGVLLIYAQQTKEDFTNITTKDEIFDIDHDEEGNPIIKFASHQSSLPTLEEISYAVSKQIRLDNNDQSAEAINKRFTEVLSLLIQEQMSSSTL